MGLFRRRRRERWVRENYQDLPPETWTEDEQDHWFQNLPEQEAWDAWDAWSRDTRPHRRVRRIRRSCLQMAAEAARTTDSPEEPREFASLLGVEGDTITELVLLPGTVSGDEHAIFDLWMAPIDKSVRGTLHSHPDEHPYPSDADFELFAHEGEIHIILCRPYGPDDWRAYSHEGVPVHLEVID